jgi:hypothetical protein
MPTLEEVLAYLGIDYADEMVNKNIERSILVADAYLKGSIGKDYPIDDPRSKELALIFISDLYDNRGMIEKVSGNVRRLVDDFTLQLKLELARASEGV